MDVTYHLNRWMKMSSNYRISLPLLPIIEYTMPRYSVDEVLEIVKSLTPEEKSLLQTQLPAFLGTATSSASPQKVQNQSQSFGNVNMESGNAFSANVVGGNNNASQSNVQASVKNADLSEVLNILQQLKQDVGNNKALNKLEKTTVESTIQVVEEELKQPKPDKNLVDQAISSLKKGLEGVQSLAEPTMKVAELVAKAWLLIL
jgi:uncharacterized membrane protein YdfJ with MMPL/SSD domain